MEKQDLIFWGEDHFIRHVLNSMEIHMLSVLKMPKAVLRMLKKIFSDFLWGSSMELRKHKWVSSSMVCKPVK